MLLCNQDEQLKQKMDFTYKAIYYNIISVDPLSSLAGFKVLALAFSNSRGLTWPRLWLLCVKMFDSVTPYTSTENELSSSSSFSVVYSIKCFQYLTPLKSIPGPRILQFCCCKGNFVSSLIYVLQIRLIAMVSQYILLYITLADPCQP